jgi:hypothetical protein
MQDPKYKIVHYLTRNGTREKAGPGGLLAEMLSSGAALVNSFVRHLQQRKRLRSAGEQGGGSEGQGGSARKRLRSTVLPGQDGQGGSAQQGVDEDSSSDHPSSGAEGFSEGQQDGAGQMPDQGDQSPFGGDSDADRDVSSAADPEQPSAQHGRLDDEDIYEEHVRTGGGWDLTFHVFTVPQASILTGKAVQFCCPNTPPLLQHWEAAHSMSDCSSGVDSDHSGEHLGVTASRRCTQWQGQGLSRKTSFPGILLATFGQEEVAVPYCTCSGTMMRQLAQAKNPDGLQQRPADTEFLLEVCSQPPCFGSFTCSRGLTGGGLVSRIAASTSSISARAPARLSSGCKSETAPPSAIPMSTSGYSASATLLAVSHRRETCTNSVKPPSPPPVPAPDLLDRCFFSFLPAGILSWKATSGDCFLNPFCLFQVGVATSGGSSGFRVGRSFHRTPAPEHFLSPPSVRETPSQCV